MFHKEPATRAKILLLPLILMACQPDSDLVEEISPPFSASTKTIPSGEWELQINGTDGGTWGCKGFLEGDSRDSFELPAQSVDLICVNGPTTGVAEYAPRDNVRFTDLSFRLDNGYVGTTILR